MKKNTEEMILLYNFTDENKVQLIKELLENMKIKVKILEHEDYRQRVGYLFGLKGFSENKNEVKDEDDFVFGYELMMFNNFTRNRLDKVLKTMRSLNIEVPICKSVVTLVNRFWSIRRVCEAMQREHLALKEQRENAK